jgi:peptide/nickel transport system substrate-binding protein
MWPAMGNERFDNIHVAAGGENYRPFLGAAPIVGTADGLLLPGLAESWDITEDGLTWSLVFRDGIKFHDGTEMTMDDVLWTYEHSYGDECADSHCDQPHNIANAQKKTGVALTGPNEISITTKIVDSGLLYQEMSDLGRLIQYIHPARPGALYDYEAELAYDANPIMSGQMYLSEHVALDKMVLERFDDYYYTTANGYPEDRSMKFQTLELRLVPEEATRASAIQAGQADVGIVSLETRDQIEAGGGRLIFGQEGVYWLIRYAHNYLVPESPFNDLGVRRAMEMSIDKELMMEKLYGGPEVAIVKGWEAVSPSTIGYTPGLDPLPYDPDQARQLLTDAGYPGGEGFGPVIINTWVSSAMPFLPESAQIAADYWKKELGLEVEVRVGDPTALNKAWAAGEFKGQIMWRDNEDRVDAAGIMGSTFGQEDNNRSAHNDPELYKIVQEGLSDFNPVTREKTLQDLYKMLRDKQLVMSMGSVNIPWGVSSRIETWEPWPLAPNPTGQHTMTLK